MSLSAKIVVSGLLALKKTGIMGQPGTDMKKELEKAGKFNARHRYTEPKDPFAAYETDWTKSWPCLLIRRKKGTEKDRVILYLHGGGDRDQWKPEIAFARTYGKRTSRTVVYPLYPPFSEASIAETGDYIYGVYRDIVSVYGKKHITVIGGSYGGFLALQLIAWINENQREARMPDLMILNSPFAYPKEEEDWKRIRELEQYDAMIPNGGLRYMCDMVRYRDAQIPDEALYLQNMDLSSLPRTYVYYTREACAFAADRIREAYRKNEAEDRLFMKIEPEMIHCYASAPVFPESRRDFRMQIEAIRDEHKGRQDR